MLMTVCVKVELVDRLRICLKFRWAAINATSSAVRSTLIVLSHQLGLFQFSSTGSPNLASPDCEVAVNQSYPPAQTFGVAKLAKTSY